MKQGASTNLDLVAQTIYDKKGFNILALDVSEISTLTDYFVIAEGNVSRHVSAIARSIQQALKEVGERPIHVEGLMSGEWVVMDYGHFIIHLFQPGLRQHYSLEELWSDGKIVRLQIDTEEGSSQAGSA